VRHLDSGKPFDVAAQQCVPLCGHRDSNDNAMALANFQLVDCTACLVEYVRQLRREHGCQAERAEHFRRRLLELEPRIERHRTLVDVGADHYMIIGCTCGLRFTTEDEAARHQAAVAPKEP
jgi:hypothetical protein